MEKQITIIIPTYNMEKYIGKCLDSLLIPEFDQVEVLVVNDGSKDRSSEIAHSYADSYPNSIRVIDKHNGNYGSCINAALPLATGRYVKILDADDTFDTAEFGLMVKTLMEVNADVVITPYIHVDEDGEVKQKCRFDELSNFFNKTVCFDKTSESFRFRHLDMHHLAYNSRVFNRLKYHQTEGISYTDTQWSDILLSYCKDFCILDFSVYRYLVGRDGQTMSLDQIKRNYNALLTVLHSEVDHLSQTSQVSNCDCVRLLKYIEKRHAIIYSIGFSTGDPLVLQKLAEYDKWLKLNNQHLYHFLDLATWRPSVRYKVFKHLRANNFSAQFKVPWYVKKEATLKSRIRRIFK